MKGIVFSVLLIVGATLAIGPVGQYLGYQIDLQAVTSGWNKDSVHLTLPVPTDTVVYLVTQDTATLSSEIPYRGLEGYLLSHQTWTNGSPLASEDTLYESLGVYMKQRQAVGDSHGSTTRYRIPFLTDSIWSAGMTGIYPVDFGHNDTTDTVTIWADTARVAGQEDVTTPYGTVPDCYKLVTTSRWCVVTWVSGIPSRDSMTVTTVEWYKDSLWRIKDSTYSPGLASVKLLGFWLRAGTITTITVNELVALGHTAIRDEWKLPPPGIPAAHVAPNPFRSCCLIEASSRDQHPAGVDVFDAAGRRVWSAALIDRIVWRPANLPAGVYQIMIREDGRPRGRALVVYQR